MFRSLFSFSFPALFLVFALLWVSPGQVQAQTPGSQAGTIIETMDASGYTYLHLEVGKEKLWVAVPAAEVTEGENITFLDGMTMQDFYSKTLDKTFPSIIFSPGLVGNTKKSPHGSAAKKTSTSSSFADAVKTESKKPAPQSLPADASGGSTGAMVPSIEVEVEKAEGDNSYTVAEIFTQAEELNGKKVKVKGKVVKFSPNIMGKNWVHIQDGSGDPMNNTHDLVVTTASQTTPDAIIIIEGVATAKKDFGFGYKYDVLIEEAEIIQ
jgi:hypothetical protein